MSYNFFIVGGDKRIFYLAESLKQDGNNVKVLGLEKCLNEQNNDELKIVNSLILVERLYGIQKILEGHPYHRE